MAIKDNIKNARLMRNLTLEDIAKIVGVTRQTIQKYESGVVTNIPSDKIELISKALNVSPAYLMGWEEKEDTTGNNAHRIPILGKVPAGIPIEAIEDVLGYEEIPETMAKTGEFFGLRVEGNSMYPLLYSGETIIIKKQASADNGDIVVALIDNEETTVKRLKVMPDGLVLEAENPEYNSLFFNEKQLQNGKLQIIGKAVESRKKL